MKYLLLTTDGDLESRDGDYAAELGAHGVAHVWLHQMRYPLHAMVPESGLLLPELYPFNEVGTALLVSLGAPLQPYAGPVVLTCWDTCAEVVGVDEGSGLLLELLHGRIRGALADDPAVPVPKTALLRDWRRDIRAVVALARTGHVSPTRIAATADPRWN